MRAGSMSELVCVRLVCVRLRTENFVASRIYMNDKRLALKIINLTAAKQQRDIARFAVSLEIWRVGLGGWEVWFLALYIFDFLFLIL